jgi:hypothetical protein
MRESGSDHDLMAGILREVWLCSMEIFLGVWSKLSSHTFGVRELRDGNPWVSLCSTHGYYPSSPNGLGIRTPLGVPVTATHAGHGLQQVFQLPESHGGATEKRAVTDRTYNLLNRASHLRRRDRGRHHQKMK